MINKEVTNMNKKEVLEIRKQFSPENCAITRICGCYVDHEKEKKMEIPERSERTSSTWNSHSTRN